MEVVNRAEPNMGHKAHGGPMQFVGHVIEMLAAMYVGMAIGGVLGVPSIESPELQAVGWLVVMTVPMVGWMLVRGMSGRAAYEMATAMVVPTILFIPLFWLGLLSGGGLICLEHSAMAPAMFFLMVLRRADFGWAD